RADGRANIIGQVLVIASHHLKEVGRCPTLVTEDEGSQPGLEQAAMEEPRRNVSRDSELPTLQDYTPDLTGRGFLFFNLTMKLKLCRIEDKGSQGAGLWPQLETMLSKVT